MTARNEIDVKIIYFIMKTRRLSLMLKVGIVFLLVEKNPGKALQKRDEEYCAILINGGLAEPQPLILCPKSNEKDFLYPYEPGNYHLVALNGESFRVACPGSALKLRGRQSINDTVVTCAGDNYVYIEDADIEVPFETLSCNKYPSYLARRANLHCGEGVAYEIGFPVRKHIAIRKKPTVRRQRDFLRLIDLCHDEIMAHTIWAHAKIFAVIDSAQRSFPRTSFRKGDFFHGIAISQVYRRDAQRETIGRILNSMELAWHLIPEKGPFYLARGHLVAKADFIYGSQQRATFFYANAVPMWQNINAGNWLTMEMNVRSYATDMDVDLDVWTGSIGILKLEDEEGYEHEIYLHFTDEERAVPVPKILFKVVYSKSSQSGIVFLTANNPYLSSLTSDYRLCEDVCQRVSYLKWKPNDRERGFSYCCEIEDFRSIFPDIPRFRTKHLLS